jgi:thiosulfate/3-mercaptopyruvate sulfurtransferase
MKKRMLFAALFVVSMMAAESSSELVDTEWLTARLSEENLRIVDIRDRIEEYGQGHIPGAVYLSPDALRGPDSEVPAKLISPEALAMLLGEMGIEENTMVVVYSGEGESKASYLVWALDTIGHQHSALLDGGFSKWQLEGRSVAQDTPKTAPTRYRIPKKRNEEVRADPKEVKEVVTRGGAILVDVRPRPLSSGNQGSRRRKGPIKGAMHHFSGDDLREDGTWRSKEELKKVYERLGVTPDKTVIVSSGRGRMSAHAYFTLKHILGYPKVKHYDGGFNEWSNFEELPVESGVPKASGAGLSLDARKLVRERCIGCHKLKRVYKPRKDKAGWEKSVARMIRKGTKLNEAERQAVVDYLSETQSKE